ncbi:MAG: UDP-N-acetylmuramoyl-L-alanyl-D-glutamate--2,6-diaminopimelate ligase [Acidimicrobiia bacterium]|nr:MAG: UDP-N-acetylmuramoyl-L-alanyl-D-glutamate--2,6-diaminopimelate ligase [Acidimicrobiia bacterium]
MGSREITVGAVAESLNAVRSVKHPDRIVVAITHDSRRVESGTMFVAVVGSQSDGHDFVDSAVDAGASAILTERKMDFDVGEIVVDDTRRAMAWAARAVYGEPDTSMDIVGVTGTNGKTTVAHMCESIWTAHDRSVGLVGTLGARLDGKPIELERTTPEATDLQELLATMRDSGVGIVVMEVSSHAMELHRADAVIFDVVAFTNLSQDHLDFHDDMAAYFDAKASLFVRDRARRAVINIDDLHGRRLLSMTTLEALTVGKSADADLRISEVSADEGGTRFTLEYQGESLRIFIPLIGEFNVSNAAVAAGIALVMGTPIEAIVDGLKSIPVIPGRMEAIVHDGGFLVLVDYAHTPDAISEVLQAGRSSARGRVIAVIGAAGDRDRDKRALMGAAAVRFADVTIITSDNPRSEDPGDIAAEVRRGADAVPGADTRVIVDRGEAIAAAIGLATDGDIVLILGKGHEQGIEVHGNVVPFDDRLVASEALAMRGLIRS